MSRYNIDKKPESLADLVPMIEAAQHELSALCQGKRFRMSVPVQDDDSDMVIGDALRHALAFVRAAMERTTGADFAVDRVVGAQHSPSTRDGSSLFSASSDVPAPTPEGGA